MSTDTAPILSTPAEHILEEPTPVAVQTSQERLSEEQLYLQYEINRTISEIRAGKWKRIALQFPDDMLVDAPRVFERLRDGLRTARAEEKVARKSHVNGNVEHLSATVQDMHLGVSEPVEAEEEVDERLCILGDTSYGACCVDEVAAEHVDADVVVHYGRSCLSPTARLPVIYVFTAKTLHLDAVVSNFKATYPERGENVILMADIPYSCHLDDLNQRLLQEGYINVYKTDIIHDPQSPIPNRTIPGSVKKDSDALKKYSIFHISSPPTSLLLILSSRIKAMHIYSTDSTPTQTSSLSPSPSATTLPLLRRRYALTTRLASNPVFGILINTLSVSNYMAALAHCQDIIAQAGKKAYVFVVGKVNAAKIANFSEIGGWVVIGCWESSLIESKEFYRPIITPFELEVALMGDEKRVWGSEWIGDFSALLGKERGVDAESAPEATSTGDGELGTEGAVNGTSSSSANWDDLPSDDEPPEFDLRTGRYVSQSRPMGRPRPSTSLTSQDPTSSADSSKPALASSALVQRAKGDVASINGQVSPAAEFLRSKRTWQGLGSDFEIAYERDDEGKIRGAAMEEGRAGVAKGYSVGESTRS